MTDPLVAIAAEISKPSHGSEWISGLTGAGGAIFGAFVTVAWTELFNRRTRKRDDRQKLAAGSFAVYQKLNHIYSLSTIVRSHFRAGLALERSAGEPICSKVQPMNRLAGPITFTTDELWIATRAGGNDLVNKVNSLDLSLNSLLDVVDLYNVERRKLFEELRPTSMKGVVGSLELTDADLKKFTPMFNSLDHLLPQIESMASSIVIDAFEALKLLVLAKAQPLGAKFEISLPDPDGKSVKFSASDAKTARSLAQQIREIFKRAP